MSDPPLAVRAPVEISAGVFYAPNPSHAGILWRQSAGTTDAFAMASIFSGDLSTSEEEWRYFSVALESRSTAVASANAAS